MYEDQTLSFFGFGEGRVRNVWGQLEYQYDYKDHLGNVRASFRSFGGYPQLIQADDYYPFGLKMPDYSLVVNYDGGAENKFTYNGKELEDEFGLGWYHCGARFYDPTVGRWWAVDPVDEFNSAYNYVGNDPIGFVDPDGASSESTNPCLTIPGLCETYLGGIWSGMKGSWNFLSDDMWKTQTWKDTGNLLLGLSLSTAPGGEGTLFALDSYLGTNTAGAYSGFLGSMDYLGGQLSSGNPYVYAELAGGATWEIGLGILGTKGLSSIRKFSLTTTSNGFMGRSFKYTLKSDLNVGFYASNKSLNYGSFQFSTIAPEALSNNSWFGRRMLQITDGPNGFQPNLGPWTTSQIKAGTEIQIGLVGRQPGQPFGTWLQFYINEPIKAGF